MEYTRLGNSGLKISKIILGGMAFGSSKWEGSPWTLDEPEALKLLKKAYDMGINTWVCTFAPFHFCDGCLQHIGHSRHILEWRI